MCAVSIGDDCSVLAGSGTLNLAHLDSGLPLVFLRDRELNAVAFGVFVPFFFVVSGMNLNIVALFASAASAQQTGDVDAASRIAAAKHGVIALQQTADAGIITRSQADEGTKRYLDEARAASGKDMTVEQLLAAPEAALRWLVVVSVLVALTAVALRVA